MWKIIKVWTDTLESKEYGTFGCILKFLFLICVFFISAVSILYLCKLLKISFHIFKVLIIPISLIKKRNRKSRKSGKCIRRMKKNPNILVIMINISKLSSPKTNVSLNFTTEKKLAIFYSQDIKCLYKDSQRT